LLADYAEEFVTGGYTEKIQKVRAEHSREFVLYLEGKFHPSTGNGKQRMITE
jgi:hypothetical protein